MKEFEQLLSTIDRLLGPDGCPWDQKQTMQSIRSNVIEESSELVEAIDLEDNTHIKEELGDLFFVIVFLCRLAEKEKRCSIESVLQEIYEKLVRRHPHVFGEVKLHTPDEVLTQWTAIKQEERKNKPKHKSLLDSIPKGLPALARGQKVYQRLHQAQFPKLQEPQELAIDNEEDLGDALFHLVAHAQNKGLDAEHALRKVLVKLESGFREFESQNLTQSSGNKD